MKKIIMAVTVWAVMTAGSYADVRWGRAGGQTDIVTTNRMFVSRTNSFNTYANSNPTTVGYYTNAAAEGASRLFSAAASIPNYTGSVTNNPEGDYIQQRSTAYTPSFRSMVLWDWAETNGTLGWINAEVSSCSSNCVTQVRLVVEKGSDYFISQSVMEVANSWFQIEHVELYSLEWYAFTPFVSGVSTIGGLGSRESGITLIHKIVAGLVPVRMSVILKHRLFRNRPPRFCWRSAAA